MFYTYAYLNPLKPGQFSYDKCPCSFLYEPFYIGKGKDDRINYHKYDNTNRLKKNILDKIQAAGLDPIRIKISDGISEADALSQEIQLIKAIGRRTSKLGPLSNLTDGGDGVSGWVPSEKELLRRSEAVRGSKNPSYGKPTYGFKGKCHSTSSKGKIRDKINGHVTPDAVKRALSNKSRLTWLSGRKISQRVSINGQIYKSIRQAQQETSICRELITKRCLENCPGYLYIN